jgi:hypothetical protein
MRLWPYAAIAATTFALASCQSVPDDGTSRNVIAMNFTSEATKTDIAHRIEKAVSECWINQDPAFAGLKLAPLSAYPDAREKGLQLPLKDPKVTDRFANINIFPANREKDTGYIVQVVQKGVGLDVSSRLDRSLRAIQQGQSPCASNSG